MCESEIADDYLEEGEDQLFEDPSVTLARHSLRDSRGLKNAALLFWVTMGLGLDDVMSQEQYMFVHRRITRALAPELDDDEAAEVAEADWEDDLGTSPSMTFERYASGLFEIADYWTGDAIAVLHGENEPCF